MQYGINLICKARSNLMMSIQKNSRSTCFFLSSPKSTCKILSGEIEGKTQLVPRLHTKYNKQGKQSNLMP